MLSQQHCYHTFLQWKENIAHCAVCDLVFLDISYDPSFVGVFPRDSIQRTLIQAVSTTLTIRPHETWRIG
jgi:hypothetical protein